MPMRLASRAAAAIPRTTTTTPRPMRCGWRSAPISTLIHEKPRTKAVFVAATKQHVGKTTTSLALVAGAQKVLGSTPSGASRVGFIKPVGQRHVVVDDGLRVDKDVVLFKEFFNLRSSDYRDMSPVVIPNGYTRDFLDGKVSEAAQMAAVERGFRAITSSHDFTIVEGTGHVGVGAVVSLDNARVASILGLDMILVVNGGIGQSVDELALNRAMCAHHGVKIKGVVLNKVVPDKLEMIKEYFGKAVARWDIPLLGVVPDYEYLSQPSMLDYEGLFKTELVIGHEHRLRHYDRITLVSMDLRRFSKRLKTEKHTKTLFVTHASRLDIVLCFVAHAQTHERIWGEKFKAGIILAGGQDIDESERQTVIDALRAQDLCPALISSRSTYSTMLLISQHTAKLSALDVKRTQKAVEHYVPHIDIERVMS